MLNDVQSGERSGLFAICNYSVSLATDPWTYGAGYSVKPVARAIKIKHAGFNPCVLGSVRLMRHRDPETAQYECVAEAVSLVKGDRLSLVMTVTKAATSGKRVRPT